MKTLHAVSLSLALLVPVFLCSCADFWFDYHNQDNPPPDTPAFDPPPQDSEPASAVELTNEQMKHILKEVLFETWEPIDADHTLCRFITSWATTERDLEALKNAL